MARARRWPMSGWRGKGPRSCAHPDRRRVARVTEGVSFTIAKGFTPDQRRAAISLFWRAFRGKLGRVMNPEDAALRFLDRAADPGHALSAVAGDGSLIGIAGFKTRKGAFIGGGMAELRAAYGAFGGLWRGLILSLLERPVKSGTLLMDGIIVEEEARGQGVGSALLAAIKTEATERGCKRVRLDVIDTNARARALYERRGFLPVSTSDTGLFRHIFGFRKSTAMVCRL